MKNSAARQKARLFATLASLNNDHSSDLRACYARVRSSSRPSFVVTKPLHPRSAAWRSSFVTNLNNTTPMHAPTVEVEACVVTVRCHVTAMTLVLSLIWPCNSYVLSHCTSSFSISPSLALKPVRRRLSLRSSCLGVLAKVSIA